MVQTLALPTFIDLDEIVKVPDAEKDFRQNMNQDTDGTAKVPRIKTGVRIPIGPKTIFT